MNQEQQIENFMNRLQGLKPKGISGNVIKNSETGGIREVNLFLKFPVYEKTFATIKEAETYLDINHS